MIAPEFETNMKLLLVFVRKCIWRDSWLPWSADNRRVGSNAKSELATILRNINFLHTRRRKKLERLHKPAKNNGQQRHGDDDSRARAPTNTERQEAEVISSRFDVTVQEALGHELVGLRPILGVIGDPPRVYKHLA